MRASIVAVLAFSLLAHATPVYRLSGQVSNGPGRVGNYEDPSVPGQFDDAIVEEELTSQLGAGAASRQEVAVKEEPKPQQDAPSPKPIRVSKDESLATWSDSDARMLKTLKYRYRDL